MHRIFIAINLPENIKNKLSTYEDHWPELPARWTKKQNLHITLVFLGDTSDEELPEICQIVREVVMRHQSFPIDLKKIYYGPPKKPPRPPKFSKEGGEKSSWEEKFGRPRMVWAEGQKSAELGDLQKDLVNSLGGQTEKEERGYAVHITLARLKQWGFKNIDPEERPQIDEEINLTFEVNSIEIMESKLKPKGPEYFVLESINLGK